jgi:uncharacterized protein (TIGR02246 family)
MEAAAHIESLIRELGERWNHYDAGGLARLFAPDADFTNAFGVAASGRDAIERFHVALFGAVFTKSRFHVEATSTRFVRPDVGVVDLRWSVVGMASRPDLHGLMAMVVTQDGPTWLIRTMHVMQFPSGEPSV